METLELVGACLMFAMFVVPGLFFFLVVIAARAERRVGRGNRLERLERMSKESASATTGVPPV
jgi:hypothetical protein